ncbi:MAG: PAS domain S-box protein [Chloroflexota bacterium]
MGVTSRAPADVGADAASPEPSPSEPARDPRFDRLTRLAARLMDVPIAFVSFLDGGDEVVVASRGFPARPIPRAISLAARAVHHGELVVVDDAAGRGDLAAHPLLTADPPAQLIVALPIRGPGGGRVGALTLADPRPRRLTTDDVDRLRDLSATCESEMVAARREEAEPTLAFQKTLLEAQTEASNDGILMTASDRRVLSFNRRLNDLWGGSGKLRPGQPIEEVIGRVIQDAEEPAAFLATLQDMATKRDQRTVASIRLKGDRTIELLSVPVFADSGEYRGRVTYFHDATRRVRALEAYRESEARFRVLTDATSEGIAAFQNGKITIANRAFAAMFGYELSDLIGRPIEDFIAPEFHPSITLSGAAAPEQAVEVVGRKKDGARFSIDVNGQAIPYKDSQIRVIAVRDLTTQKQAQEELVRLSHRNSLILNSAGDGIVGLDPRGEVTFANPSAARMTGYKVEELLGQRFHDLTHHSHPDGSDYPYDECPQRRVLSMGTPRWVTGEVFWRKDGTSFPVEYVCAPIPEGEEIVGVVLTFKDVSERQLIERMKDEFISVVSHELRTPLTAIRGSLGLLASGMIGPMPGRAQHMLDIAVKNTDRLVNLINDILDIERIESGKVSMLKADCDAADLITQASELMQALADKAGVSLSATPFSAPLFADPDRVVQVLTNLLSNAIKFSYPGGTVWLTAERYGDEIRFQVRDQGRGIPRDKLEKIFERFQQVDTSDSRVKGGTGLGLAICRSIAHQHGGRIWAETGRAPCAAGLGPGSTFLFTLPTVDVRRQESLAPGRDDRPEPAVARPARAPRVLIVEDDQDLADVLVAMFQRHGVETFRAQTGRDGIQLSQQVQPDLLVLDLILPDGDGFSVVDWLRHHERLRNVALVVYSARDLSEEDRERLKLARTEYVTKGRITPDEFETEVIAMLDRIGPGGR